MKTSKALINILSGISQLILQHRIELMQSFMVHIGELKKQLANFRAGQTSLQEILYFLVQKEYFQIKQKLFPKNKTNDLENTTIQLLFKATNKITNEERVYEIWEIRLQKHAIEVLQKQTIDKEIIGTLEQLLGRLSKQQIFSDLLMSKQNRKKCIIDFRVQILDSNQPQNKDHDLEKMWQKWTTLDSARNLVLKCYYSGNLQEITETVIQQKSAKKKPRTYSQNTRQDSQEYFLSSKEVNLNKRKLSYRDSHEQIYEYYDEELEVTILSNNDSSSHCLPCQTIEQELTTDFEILTQESNEDQKFLNDFKEVFMKSSALEQRYFNK